MQVKKETEIYGNAKLAKIGILPILCVCEKTRLFERNLQWERLGICTLSVCVDSRGDTGKDSCFFLFGLEFR